MAIVTLTTDLGTKDFYTASIKGRIFSLCPSCTIVDVTHEIPAYDIQVAAFALKNTFPDFPKGSIHIIGVNPVENESQKHILIIHKGHYFIGADNGVFSLLFDDVPEQVFKLNIKDQNPQKTFPAKDVFARAAAFIANGENIEEIIQGPHVIQEKNSLAPVVESDSIRGLCIYIDTMGNITTNIPLELFNYVGKGRDFKISYRREDYTITSISQSYDNVPEGEKLALFNNFNYLEIAINKGNANKLFGMNQYDTIRIDFK